MLSYDNCSRPRRATPSSSTTQQPMIARNIAQGDDGYMRLALDTIDELEWCLEQLETVQTHRSVSDMASLKVKHTFFVIFNILKFEFKIWSSKF